MYSKINEKLDFLRQGIARLHKVEAMIAQLKSAQRNLKIKESELKKIFEKESLDVEKLENGSIASAFLTIIRKLDDRIEEERGEMLAAKLKYDQVIRDIDDVNDHLSELSSERLKYGGCQSEFDALFAQKKESLIRDNGETGQRILDLTEKISKLHIRLKEAQEAISAGKDVLNSLDGVLNSIKKAQDWGTWDIFGGGIIAGWEKHAYMDYATTQTEKAQFLLRKFKTELVDVKIDSEICMNNIDSFSRFADFFFDNFITDIFIQKRIKASYDNVVSVYKQVVNVNSELKKIVDSDTDDIRKLEDELSSLVINV